MAALTQKQRTINNIKNPLYFIKNILGTRLWSKQKEIVEAVWANKRTTVKASHGVGKCLSYGETVILSDGTIEKVENLLGTVQMIKSFEDGRQVDRLAMFNDNGEKECIRIVTMSGKVIECTTNHPLWVGGFDSSRPNKINGHQSQVSDLGWLDAEHIKDNHIIKLTRKIEIESNIKIKDDIVKILGYLCGNGGTTISVKFSTGNGEHLNEFNEIVDRNFNVKCFQENKYNYRYTKGYNSSEKNELIELCKEHNLYGCRSKEKRIPKQIFQLDEQQIALFISRLFACDGYIVKRSNRKTFYVGITLASKGMIEDLEYLFLRLGIFTRVRYKKSKCEGKTFDAWELVLNRSNDIIKYFDIIGGKFGQEEKSKLAIESLKEYNLNKTQKWMYDLCSEWEQWDKIKSIERVGIKPTVAVTVEGTETFLTKFVQHNTAVAGNLLLAFLYTNYPSIVLTTAPTWRQVEKLLWKEVRNAYSKATINLGGSIAPKSPELQIIQDQWYAMGLSTDNPDKFQGFHSKNILIIVDEAAGINSKIFEGIEGILSSANSHLLLIGNPTSTSGEFYKSFKDESYKKITISAFDSPNFKQCGITEDDIANGDWMEKYTLILNKKGQLVSPSMVTPEWVADKYKRWKPGSILYESKVRGNFPVQSEDSLIPVSWIEAAMDRWEDVEDDESELREMGADVAEFGGDDTVLAKRFGRKIKEILVFNGIDETKIIAHMRIHYSRDNMTCVKIDGIGMGHPVVSMAKNAGMNALCVKGSCGVANIDDEEEQDELFANLRAKMYWNLRELLNPNRILNPFPIALPKDEYLLQELTEIKWKPDSRGRILIEEKKEIRKRMGRSPDRADAVALAFTEKDWLKEEEDYEPTIFIPRY